MTVIERSSPTNGACGWIKSTVVLNPYQANNASSALGRSHWPSPCHLHFSFASFHWSVHSSIRLSAWLPACVSVCLSVWCVSTMLARCRCLQKQVQMCCSCNPPLRLLFYFVLKAAWDGSSTVVTNCDFTAGPKVVVAAPQSPLSHLSSLPSLPASIFIQGFKVLQLNVWQLPELQRFPYLLNLIFQIVSACCSKGRIEEKIEV